jgi:putative peptidoglycan lipid II flippase
MSSTKKTALLITIIVLCSKLIGFTREIILAYFYGTSHVVDAYLMAYAIPSIVFGWIISLSVTYTPIYTDVRVKLGEDKSIKFTNNIISIAVTLSLASAVLGIIFSSQIVNLAAPGFEGKVYELTDKFVKVSVLSVIFNVFAQILIAYLNCDEKFVLSNLSGLAVSSTQLLIIYLSSKAGIEVLKYSLVLPYLFQLAILYIFSTKNGYRFKFELKITPEIKQAFAILAPIFISSMISQINGFINKIFASGLVEGSISSLNYSITIRRFIYDIFSIAITTMIYPMISKGIANNDKDGVKNMVTKAINIVIILFIPITVGGILLSKQAVYFIYERGQFGSQSTQMTSLALQMYFLGLSALVLRDILTKVFYSMKDTKISLYLNLVTVGLCIVFSASLVKPMAHGGLALASSLSEIITLPLFFIILRKRLGNLGMRNSLFIFIKSSVSSFIMGISVYFIIGYMNSILGTAKLFTLLSIAISAAIGALIYLIIMKLMKVKEMDYFMDIIKAMFKYRGDYAE